MDDVIDVLFEFRIALGGDADDNGVTRLDFLDVRQGLLIDALLRRERDDGHALDDERERAVLELARRIGLGVNIGNLLELQRAFKRHMIVETASDEEDVLVEAVLLRKRLDRLDVAQRLADLRGNLRKSLDQSLAALLRERSLEICHVDGEHEHQDELRRVRLRRGDGDLRPRPSVKHLRRLARDGRADDVRDSKALRAQTLGLLQGGKRVARLARLADDDHQGVLVDDRRTVAELRRNVNLDGDARELLDVVLADKTRMIRRAAGDDVNLIKRIEEFAAPAQLVHDDMLAVLGNARRHRVAHGLRLLVNLLEHEVLVATLFRRLGVPVDLEDLLRHDFAAAIRDVHAVRLDDRHLTVIDDVGAPRARDDRGDVGRDEILPFAETDDKRIVLLRADQTVGMLARHEYESVRSFDTRKHLAHRGLEVAVVDFLQQVCDDLRIRLRLEGMTFFNQIFLQRHIVFDDAVVHNGKIARAVCMRMCVAVRRTSMCRPTRMTDADMTCRLISFDDSLEFGKTTHAFFHADLLLVQDGDARRIIAAILKLRQPLDEKRRRLTLADITNDSTHKQKPPKFPADKTPAIPYSFLFLPIL